MASAGERWTVGMLPAPLSVGAVVDRRAWPLHVTIAGNFSTSAEASAVVAAVGRAVPAREGLIELGPETMFSRGVSVLLVKSAWLDAVHRRLAGELERLPGFASDEPQFWLDGYVPHVTLGPNVIASSGDVVRFTTIAVSRLASGEAKIVAEFPVP